MLTWDMTVNIPLLVSVIASSVGIIWKLASLLTEWRFGVRRVDERLLKIEQVLDQFLAALDTHREEDRSSFEDMGTRLTRIETRQKESGEPVRPRPRH